MELDRDLMKKAIHRSQHCQRNWDLSREIPAEDLDLLVTAVTQCPSKQNLAFYKSHFITNREVIEKIHAKTDGFSISYTEGTSTTNTQCLANLLVVFESVPLSLEQPVDQSRSAQTKAIADGTDTATDHEYLRRDAEMAVGIAAGYLNLSASLLGFATGCCLCFDGEAVREILGCEGSIMLLMGIGYKNPDLGRRVHHLNHSFVFPTKVKQPIQVKIVP